MVFPHLNLIVLWVNFGFKYSVSMNTLVKLLIEINKNNMIFTRWIVLQIFMVLAILSTYGNERDVELVNDYSSHQNKSCKSKNSLVNKFTYQFRKKKSLAKEI